MRATLLIAASEIASPAGLNLRGVGLFKIKLRELSRPVLGLILRL